MRYTNYMAQIFVALKIGSNKLCNRHAETHMMGYLSISTLAPPRKARNTCHLS